MSNKFLAGMLVAALSPVIFAGDTYIETGDSKYFQIEHTLDSGLYFKFKGLSGDANELDTKKETAFIHSEDNGTRKDFEFGFNFKPINNLTLTPHLGLNNREENAVIYNLNGMELYDRDRVDYDYLTIGLDVKYSLPKNTYIALNTEVGEKEDVQGGSAHRYAWSIEAGYTDPKTRISVHVGYGASQGVLEYFDDNLIDEAKPAPYIGVGWTF